MPLAPIWVSSLENLEKSLQHWDRVPKKIVAKAMEPQIKEFWAQWGPSMRMDECHLTNFESRLMDSQPIDSSQYLDHALSIYN